MRKPSWIFDTRGISNINDAEKYGIKFWRIGCDLDYKDH